MKPAAFDYQRPDTLDGVLALLADSALDTKIIAGGQSLVPMMNFRLARPERLIDVNRIAGLSAISVEGGFLKIGAMARHNAVKDSAHVAKAAPVIPVAYEWVAHSTIRNRGTFGGNLCHADPASEMPMLMMLLDGVMVAKSTRGTRHIKAADFFTGVYQTALESDEMLVEVHVPVAPASQGFGFHEVSLRKGDFAFCAAAATMMIAKGKITQVALAVGGVSSTALRLHDAETAMIGHAPSAELIAKVTASTIAPLDIMGDLRAPAEYRRDLAISLTRRALADAMATAN
jgi:aerobic carbon-monoxide dehydrogenase medium subunit